MRCLPVHVLVWQQAAVVRDDLHVMLLLLLLLLLLGKQLLYAPM